MRDASVSETSPSEVPAHTGSRTTRILGVANIVGFALLAVLSFTWVPEDLRVTDDGDLVGQRDAVRLIFVHVPSALLAYAAFSLTALASVMVLWKRSRWWDHVAHASAEIGVLFAALTLVTGIIWGRPTWGTWWEWGDVRLLTTLVLFLIFVGYLALRRIPDDPQVQARRAAVVALIGAANIVIVNRSVEWWENRTLHQQSTLAELKIADQTLFTLVFAIAVFTVLFAWLLIHRFRIAWLEAEADAAVLDQALAERRAEAEGLALETTS